MAAEQTLDIIIPTYRPGDKFIRLLDMLKRQTIPYHELIVVNTEESMMDERVKAALMSMPRVRLSHILQEDFDHAGTRRSAARLSSADYFVCMTDDAVPADIYLFEQLLKGFEESDTAIVYARQLPAKDTNEAEKFTRRFNYPDNSRKKTINDLKTLGIKTYFASNVCCAYDRRVYEELGGFIESAVFNEDMIYAAGALKAGYAVFYQAKARVIHAHNYTAMQQLRRNFDLGMSQEMHPEVFAGVHSEGEGIRLVRETARHLVRTGHIPEIPRLILHSGCKYLGYRLGKAWKRLPASVIMRLAMNKTFAKRLTGAGKHENA